jgi:hypothetical protein
MCAERYVMGMRGDVEAACGHERVRAGHAPKRRAGRPQVSDDA